ncbi:MAG: hypothetical protein CMA07_06090 [Euryarchaeota archaeon]|nr:hypothetical protein [Euryarchaeota archaeon]|tara:strand:- start:889 stop:1692 length:804 start_codon:yes stop_codon:yes gene_type:complete
MLLYKTQPKNSVESTVINLSTKEKIVNDIRESIPKFQGKETKVSDVTTMVTDASILDALLAVSEYENILVVPSFENSDYTRLRDRNYRSERSAGDHLLPIIHAINESHGKLYVAQPRVGNIFSDLYEKYNVNIIHSDSWFKVDGSFHMETDIKFDCVVLLGNEGYKKGNYNGGEVKRKFEKYCRGHFEMVDVYRGNLRSLQGGRSADKQVIDRVINAVNTPKPIYKPQAVKYISKPMMSTIRHGKDRLLYLRLAVNLAHCDKWYKVY